MKKLLITLCIGLIAILYAGTDAVTHPGTPESVFKTDGSGIPYSGPRATPTLIDTINLSPINAAGYCWGITYDWDRDVLWVSQWNSAYPRVFAINKTSPCTKVDSFTLGGGAPTYHLGMGYAGSDILYMAGYNASVYRINMTTGAGSVYRSMPWSSAEGLGFNAADDAIYPGDWTADQCAWAKPSQTGAWTTWSLTDVSGLSGSYSNSSPAWLFTCDEASPGHFYQHQLTAGVPNTTPDSAWTFDAGQTQTLTADMAFDGQYIYVLDQSGPDKIWVYDIGLTLADTVVWDFETGWQGWTKTGAYPFPNGWGVITSGYYPSYAPPAPDDSCLWFDDDAAGSGAPALIDTAKSPLLIPDGDLTVWLKWGAGFNWLSSSEVFQIGIKYFDGASWTVVPLRNYTADFVGWDSADVSAYNDYDLIQIYAYYNDGGGWQWYGAIDNISIIGTLFTGYNHDVGCDDILQPPTSVMPNTVVAPQAHYENFGLNGETFAIHFDIDSSGTNVYTQTYNITLAPGADTIVTFPNWTAGPSNGIVYDCYSYTVLGGDESPANDTTAIQVTVQSMFWEILDPPVFPAATYGHAMASANDGFHITFSAGASNNQVEIYDIAANTFTSGAPCPTGTHAFPALGYVNGNFYLVGGWNGSAATNQVDIYNAGGNSWSSGATAPTNVIDCASGVYKDTILYTIGGGNWYSSVAPHNMVHAYNTVTNSWVQATSYPGSPRGCLAGGVIDSFIIVEGGYDGSAMRIDYVVGVINAANPATIAWGTPTNVPGIDSLYRIPCAVDISNKELWITCGQFWGAVPNRTYSYSPYTNTWTEYAFPKPQAVCNVTPVVITETALGDLGLFVAGGYFASAAVNDHEVFHTGLTGIEEKPFERTAVQKFGFAPNMPNPVMGHTPISYTTTRSGKVSLKIYDGSGRLIRTLVDRVNEIAGSKTVYWNGNDDQSRPVSNGVYFVQLEAENKTDTYKLILIK